MTTATVPAHARIRAHLDAAARLLQATPAEPVAEAATRLIDCLAGGGKILVCGNGGSAAQAQHFVAELVSGLGRARRPYPALALTADTCLLTAHANDYGYPDVFARQVAALGLPGDVLIALSTSGRSTNVLGALDAAQARGVGTVLLTGMTGGAAACRADTVVCVPSPSTQHVQEVHQAVLHCWAAAIEREVP